VSVGARNLPTAMIQSNTVSTMVLTPISNSTQTPLAICPASEKMIVIT
jgi:hypothetical protein